MPVWAKPEWVADEWVLRYARTGRVIAQMPDGVWYFEQAHFPFLEHEDLDQLEAEFSECMWSAVASPPGPIVAGPDGAERLAAGARQLRAETDRAIIGLFGGNLLELGQWFYRNDQFFMLLAAEPERGTRFWNGSPKFTCANWNASPARSGDTLTSFCSATIWACKKVRRFHRRCIANFSNRASNASGGAPGN